MQTRSHQENDPIDARDLALSLADLIDERQGEDIVILDVSGPLAIADFFVIATARNDRQAQAIARELMRARKAEGQLRRHAAGLEGESGWVLLDFDEVVAHLFVAEKRDFYALEALWSDVPRLPFTPVERPAGRTQDPFGDTGWSGDSGWSGTVPDL